MKVEAKMRTDKFDDGLDEWGDTLPKKAAPKSGRWVRARWSVSPLREAKTLLGVLQQEGLRGKGLVQAFENHSPRLLGYSREDMGKLYRHQTGRDLTDYILVQKADKAVRYNELGPEATLLSRTLRKLRAGD
jgi:hypothetical protein